jgi:hypothetical protein
MKRLVVDWNERLWVEQRFSAALELDELSGFSR